MDRCLPFHDSEGTFAVPPVAGGRIPGAAERHAFWVKALQPSAVPVVIAVPHAGRSYPPGLLAAMRHPAQDCLRLEDRLVDRLGEAVAGLTGAALIVAEAPRAMIDLNRAADDVDWTMVAGGAAADQPSAGSGPVRGRARSGLGLVPRRLPVSGEIWKRPLEPRELAARIAQVHEPYHQVLAGLLDQVRRRWGAALLIDLHSMPPVPAAPGAPPPEFVIGDRFGAACAGGLVAAAFGYLGQAGRLAAHNRPYAGGFGLERHARPHGGVHGLQIEIDRRCYLEPSLADLGEGFGDTVQLLAGLVAELAARVAELGANAADRGWREAAE